MMENKLLCYCATVQWGQKGNQAMGWPQTLQWPAPIAAGRQQQRRTEQGKACKAGKAWKMQGVRVRVKVKETHKGGR